MGTQTRQATGIGTTDTWTANGAATKYECVDEGVASANGNTDYIEKATTTGNQDFTFAPFSLGAISGVSGIIVRSNAQYTGGAVSLRNRLRVGGTVYTGALNALSSSYATYTETWLTNPATGALWTQADAEGTGANPVQQFGVGNLSGIAAGETVRCTAVEVECDYSATVAGEVAKRRWNAGFNGHWGGVN